MQQINYVLAVVLAFFYCSYLLAQEPPPPVIAVKPIVLPADYAGGPLGHEICRQYVIATLQLYGEARVVDMTMCKAPEQTDLTLHIDVVLKPNPQIIKITDADDHELVAIDLNQRLVDEGIAYVKLLHAWRTLHQKQLIDSLEGHIELVRPQVDNAVEAARPATELYRMHQQGDLFNQFVLLRTIHKHLSADGPNAAMCGLAGRSYAVLGRSMLQTCSRLAIVYVARAMVYASIAEQLSQNDWRSRMDMAFVLAMVGRENDALEIVEKLKPDHRDESLLQALDALCRYIPDSFPEERRSPLDYRLRAMIALACAVPILGISNC